MRVASGSRATSGGATPFGRWLLRVFARDGLPPVGLALVTAALGRAFPGRPDAIELAATILPIASTDRYRAAIFFNAAMFAAASLGAHVLLRRAYRPPIAAAPRHWAMLRAWLLVSALIGIRMGWLLRPFIGQPGAPFQHYRADARGNSHVILAGMAAELLRGAAR